jgi:hypothetical protein
MDLEFPRRFLVEGKTKFGYNEMPDYSLEANWDTPGFTFHREFYYFRWQALGSVQASQSRALPGL